MSVARVHCCSCSGAADDALRVRGGKYVEVCVFARGSDQRPSAALVAFFNAIVVLCVCLPLLKNA